MTHEDAFRQAIVESPDDDTPRLVYADWLDEHGDGPRAEFIRVQCRLAALPGRPSILSRERPIDGERLADPCLKALLVREWELWRDHRQRWHDELPRPPGIRWWAFERGFAVEVEARSWRAFATHATTVLDAAPVQEALLPCGPRTIPKLARSPHLARLRVLRLRGAGPQDADIHLLADSPHLTRLRTLALEGRYRLGPVSVEALAASPNLTGLASLYLANAALGDAGAAALARSTNLPTLATLCLSRNAIGDTGALALAEASALHGLVHLDLSRNQIGAVGALALAGAEWMGRLQRLELCENPIDGGAADALRERFGNRVSVGRPSYDEAWGRFESELMSRST